VDAPTRWLLMKRGGEVITGAAVTQAHGEGVVLDDGREIAADAVVLALPPGRARTVAPDALPVDPDLGTAPIVNVHLWYDRPVMSEPILAVVDSPVQWIFDRTAITGEGAPGQHLALSISGAHDEMGVSRPALAEQMDAEIRALFPAALHACTDGWVAKFGRACEARTTLLLLCVASAVGGALAYELAGHSALAPAFALCFSAVDTYVLRPQPELTRVTLALSDLETRLETASSERSERSLGPAAL
jgi:hypothetical protein